MLYLIVDIFGGTRANLRFWLVSSIVDYSFKERRENYDRALSQSFSFFGYKMPVSTWKKYATYRWAGPCWLLSHRNYIVIWLTPRAGKMIQTLCCDWLIWRYLALSGFSAVFRKNMAFFLHYNKSSIDQACSVKMTRSPVGLVSVRKQSKKELFEFNHLGLTPCQ